MEKKKSSSFDFGETSESAKRALNLLKPRRRPGTENDAALAEWAFNALLMEQYRRLGIIADNYNIDLLSRDGGILLAMNLARDFVKGFDPLSSRRGTKKSAIGLHSALVLEIMQSMKEKNRTLSAAIEASRKPGRKGFGKSHEKIEAIYHRVIENLDRDRHCIESALERMRADADVKERMSLFNLGKLPRSGKLDGQGATKNEKEFP